MARGGRSTGCAWLCHAVLLTRLPLNLGAISHQATVLNRADLESIHKYSDHHRELLARSDRAGCFYCQAMFAPSEIVDWIDGPQLETGSTAGGVTALCPRCGIDAVLPSAAPISVTAEVLAAMHDHWFKR